jgi:hypothetical protein
VNKIDVASPVILTMTVDIALNAAPSGDALTCRSAHSPRRTARDGGRLLQAWDRRDRRRHVPPCAGPLLRRLKVPAWTGEAEDPVLRHAGGPRRLLDGGRWPGVVV